MIWALLLATGLAEEPSPEAMFEAHTLELREQLTGYEVVKNGESLTASEFAGLVGDERGLRALRRARERQHATALSAMGASALCIGGGSFAMAHGLARNTGEARGGAPARQMAVGGGFVLGGVALYGVTAALLMNRGPRLERVDRHYAPDEVSEWMGRYHQALQTQLGVEAPEPER